MADLEPPSKLSSVVDNVAPASVSGRKRAYETIDMTDANEASSGLRLRNIDQPNDRSNNIMYHRPRPALRNQ